MNSPTPTWKMLFSSARWRLLALREIFSFCSQFQDSGDAVFGKGKNKDIRRGFAYEKRLGRCNKKYREREE